MLRKVILMVGVSHTSRVVEICYVDFHRTIGHNGLFIGWVFPNGIPSEQFNPFFLPEVSSYLGVQLPWSPDILSRSRLTVVLFRQSLVYPCNTGVHLLVPSASVVFPVFPLTDLTTPLHAVQVSYSFPASLILSRNESSMVCICIAAIMALDSIVISSRRLLCVWMSSSSKYELSCGSGLGTQMLTLSSSQIISRLGQMSLEPNPWVPLSMCSRLSISMPSCVPTFFHD